MLKLQKSHQSEAVDGSLPSSKEHGSSHVAWRNVMHFRELDAFVALFECPELMSQSLAAKARPRSPITRYSGLKP